MFAGIVEGTRPVVGALEKTDGVDLRIDLQGFASGVAIGDSISIDGVCLTVVSIKKRVATFHIMAETLRKTALDALQKGSMVNIERSLRANDRIHGHFVQGHIFGLGTVTKRIDTKKEFKLWIDAGKLAKYIAPVGSVAVHGVSLTVADVRKNLFAVALIPVTLERTNLGTLQNGDKVNLEPDMVARQIVTFLERQREAPGL